MIKLLPYIFFRKKSIGKGQPRAPALCHLYRHTSFPAVDTASFSRRSELFPIASTSAMADERLLVIFPVKQRNRQQINQLKRVRRNSRDSWANKAAVVHCRLRPQQPQPVIPATASARAAVWDTTQQRCNGLRTTTQ